MLDFNAANSQGFALAGLYGGTDSPLIQMLLASDIVPGSAPGYQLCKIIYSYHPLGAILADSPVTRAQALAREIDVPVLGERRIIEQFQATWDTIGKVGATVILHNLVKTSRIYGLASLAVGEYDGDPMQPIDTKKIATADIFFNVLDPLNTAGSLVLNQDPNSPDFLKPRVVYVAGQPYHPSRIFVKMNEQPLYIDWTASAFGFVGRSIYQRALYPMKSFIQSMVTDDMVTKKVGLLVAKLKAPGSFMDNLINAFAAMKRSTIKSGVSGQVLQISPEEDIATLNMENLHNAGNYARTNILKNIASAAGMPASIIAQETLTEGFGEGTEDAKKEASYLDFIRADMQPAYDFMDRIVQRRAWTPEFYETLFVEYPDYKAIPFETALYGWIRAFKATWPNLLVEPDSEKSKTADVQFKAVVAMVETMSELLDPENKAKLLVWAAENANEREELFASKLFLDEESLATYLEETKEREEEQAEKAMEEPEQKPRPFAAAS